MRSVRPVVALVSPRDYADIDRVCRVGQTLCATCEACGEVIAAGAHMPFIAHGFFHADCCPCKEFVPTAEEVAAMEANAAGVSKVVVVEAAAETVTRVPETRRIRRLPSRVTAVRYKDGDIVRRANAVSPRFRPDGRRGVVCSLIGDGDGISWGELARQSPVSEYETFLIVRRLERVTKAVVVERVG